LPEQRLLGLIQRASEQSGKQVVVLIDEYNKPLTDTLSDPDLNQRIRIALRGFYGMSKGREKCTCLQVRKSSSIYSEIHLSTYLLAAPWVKLIIKPIMRKLILPVQPRAASAPYQWFVPR
jgi:hypothetical protein